MIACRKKAAGTDASQDTKKRKSKKGAPDEDVVGLGEPVPPKKRGRKKKHETTAGERVKKDQLVQSLRAQAGGEQLDMEIDAGGDTKQQEMEIGLTKNEHNRIWRNKRVGTFQLPVRLLE